MELIDALNLRGWRTAAIIVVACVGAAVGLFVPRSTPFASQHIVFAGQLTSDNLTPGQIEDFTDELRLAAGLPAVREAVEGQLANEFSAEVGGTTSDASIRITATAANETTARDSSRLIGVEAASFVIGQSIERNNSLVTALEAELESVLAEQDLIADEADGINPASALDVASELLFVAQQDAAAGDASAVIRAAALETEVEELRPLAQRYLRLEQDVTALNSELGQARADSARGQNALANIDNELFITELSTRQQSAAPQLVQNMLLFAGLNVVALILVFFLIDRLGKRPTAEDQPDDEALVDLTETRPKAQAAVTDSGPRIEAPPARLTDGGSAPRTGRERRLSATSSPRSVESDNKTADADVDAGEETAAVVAKVEKTAPKATTATPSKTAATTEPAKPSRPVKKKRSPSKAPTTTSSNGSPKQSSQAKTKVSTKDAKAEKAEDAANKSPSPTQNSTRPAAKRVSR